MNSEILEKNELLGEMDNYLCIWLEGGIINLHFMVKETFFTKLEIYLWVSVGAGIVLT